jgi:adenylate cyclase, class 2
VDDHEPVRRKLRELGAARVSDVLELNRFFDARDDALRTSGRGLRLRTNSNLDSKQVIHIITYKGPRQPGPLKRREEIEVAVDDPDAATALLESLGFALALTFEKRRETWKLDECKIELDELPHLGRYLEIEGPADIEVMQMRQRLALDQLPTITDSYAGLIRRHLRSQESSKQSLRF